MIIHAKLLVDQPDLIKGLANGSLRRIGGVIRDANGGHIVKHLLETQGTSDLLKSALIPSPFSAISTVSNVFGNFQLHGIQQTLGNVLQISQIAAGASVLSLGISAVGFAYMGYKLRQLQISLNEVQRSLEEGFHRIAGKLDHMSGQLNYLLVLAAESMEGQKEIREAVGDVHRLLVYKEIANLETELTILRRNPVAGSSESIRRASKTRSVLRNESERQTAKLNAADMIVTDMAIQGWAVALSTESRLLLKEGEFKESIDVLSADLDRFSLVVQRWAETLLSIEGKELGTAHRFQASRFSPYIVPAIEKHRTPERVERIARISPFDKGLSQDEVRRKVKNVEVEFTLTGMERLDDDWTTSQLAVAEFLDGMSELKDRLESQLALARLCEASGIRNVEEMVPSSEGSPGEAGIYTLDPI